MENNESFASPKEEAPIINQLEETIVEWLKSGDENATNLAYQIFFKHIERKEPSSERPDFPEWIKSKDGVDCMRWPISEPKYLHNRLSWAFDAGRNCVWDQFMKQKEKLQSLEQEIERLREELKSKQ